MIKVLAGFFITLWLSSNAHAAPLSPENVPLPLKPWIDWVLQDKEELNCPFLYNSAQERHCSWPSQIKLDLNSKEGVFESRWRVYKESWLLLPGDEKVWPLNITVNKQPALVLKRNGKPALKLESGSYEIRGNFLWERIPENLTMPDDTGLLSLTVNGKMIMAPVIKQGRLWLKAEDSGRKKTESVRNSLDTQVFRKIIDDVPMQVATMLDIEVAGEQREIKLAKPLLDGFVPLKIQSPLPARLEPDGQLLVQVRPGRWQIEVWGRSTEAKKALTLPENNKAWPQQEVWVFEGRPALRVVEPENLPAIDPSQTNLPAQWQSLPAYRIEQGGNLAFKVIRRGDPEPEPNRLNLSRKIWLDFNGQGYTVNDKITGILTRGWRLDTLPGMTIGKVNLDNKSQLITRQTSSDKQGIEIRKGSVNLDADSRIEGSIDTINAVGWEQNFDQVRAELNLPPGWRLLGAQGVDNVPDSWISRWTLLDLFLVLIAALATAKLWNYRWGGVALLTFILIWHEPGAPHLVWLNILAATALLKVLPAGKFKIAVNSYRYAAWGILVLIALPFMVAQVRIGLYPQLEKPWQNIQPPIYASDEAVEFAPQAETMNRTFSESKLAGKARSALKEAGGYGDYKQQQVNFERIDPNAKIQTGPGLPQWQWHSIHLIWNGAVNAEQELRLWYITPTLNMLLNFSRVLLITVMALLMIGYRDQWVKLRSSYFGLLLVIVLPVLMPVKNGWASYPDQAMLQELKNRLLEAPDCLPECAQIQQMNLQVSDREMVIELQIHAQQETIVPLPAQYEQWYPNQVLVDGQPADALYSMQESLRLSIPAGRHQIIMRGIMPNLSRIVLPLPLKPSRVSAKSTGWDIVGINENGTSDKQLQISKIKTVTAEQAKVQIEPGLLPPFVKVERTLHLGLDWRVSTRVIRISPVGSAVVLAVPLLSGEAVTTENVRVKEGKAIINMTAEQKMMAWQSVLTKTEKLGLIAAGTQQWIEVWKADISPIWHIETAGLAMMHLNKKGYWQPEWHPWPGEQLEFTITRPEPVTGNTLTIENSYLEIKPGLRSRHAELKLTINSSQGTQHAIKLPDQAELQAVVIDGNTQPVRQQERTVILPIHPGKQTIDLTWQANQDISSIIKTPVIDLGADSVNTNLQISLGQDRWVLLTFGPRFGPAVLFWGVLIVIALISLGLGRLTITPLKNWHWFLLLVGLSQIPVGSAAVVVAWLITLGLRRQKQPASKAYFNALQIVLAGLTVMSLLLLFFAIEHGLLGTPEMQITGNQSSVNQLKWYQDRSQAELPIATSISVSVTVYRILMLMWALWLASALLKWLRWGWECFSVNGLWRKKRSD